MLTIVDSLPEGLLNASAPELYKYLNGPTLIHLQGKKTRPVFLSTLLHGNELTGWDAVRKLLIKYQDRELPGSLSILIGNIEAARQNKRHLDNQPDFNRVWKDGDSPEHRMMQYILEEMEKRQVRLSVDIHNNTGKNPHYACINHLNNDFLQLASLFSRTVVYFMQPDSVQSIAFARLCPSVTVECGQSQVTQGTEHAFEYIDNLLHLSDLPSRKVTSRDIDLFHTKAIVKIMDDCVFGFNHEDVDLNLDSGLERLNFSELPRDTFIGKIKNNKIPFIAIDEAGKDVAQEYFLLDELEVHLRQKVIPAMLTLNTEVIKQDCFCYFMERYPLSE